MNTLKDLAELCYQGWLTTGDTELPSGAIKWIRDGLGEPGLAGQIEEIFSAAIKPSEKCYRFLKLAISESPKAITCRFLRLFGFSAGSIECTNLEL
jgi:hypothetical protein